MPRLGWRRVIVTAACLAAWQGMGQIAIAPVQRSGLLGLIASSRPAYSIIAMGVEPYINTVILFTVLRAISNTVRRLSDDEAGRRRIERWIRALTILLAAGQAYGFTSLFGSDAWIPQISSLQRCMFIAELTAGTMVLVLLADVLDEHGLGCGYGVYLLYFAGFLPRQAALIHDYLSFVSANPGQSTYQPLELWVLFMLALTAVSVAMVAARRVVSVHRKRRPLELHFPLLMSGVLRPALLANAVMAFPILMSSYFNATHPEIPQWFTENWTAYGPHPWGDVLYTVAHACVVLGMACFVVAVDFNPGLVAETLRKAHMTIAEAGAEGDAVRLIRATGFRLAFAGGIYLALVLGVLPVALRTLTEGPFHNGPPLSTSLTIFFPALILPIVAALQRPRDDVLVLRPRVL